MPATYTATTSVLYIPENVKRIVFTLLGGSGGGEYVNRITGSPSAGYNGGDTTFLGITAGGGRGGGIGGRNAGGDGGVASSGIYDFSPSALSSGSTVTLTNGSRGQLNSGGAGASLNTGTITGDKTNLYARNGGDGTSDNVTYTSTIYHYFNGGSYNIVNTSPDISVQIMNYWVTNAPCGTYTWARYYRISFNFPFDNANYSAYITSPYPTATAQGGLWIGGSAYFTKSSNVLNVWWCKNRIQGGGTVNSYVNQFGIAVRGSRTSLRGRGGGGGAEVTGVLTRADLLSRGMLDKQTSLIIGTGGGTSSNPSIGPLAVSGLYGGAYVYIEFETRTFIEVKNNPTDTIVYGESAVIRWEVTGDADWALVEPGISPQTYGGANFASEVTVTPTATTTYFVRADGTVGGFSESSVTLTVLQRPTITITTPSSVEYGDNIVLSYEAENAVTSLTLRPVFYYLDGTTITGSAYNVTLEYGESVSSSINYTSTPWTDKGPWKIEFNIDAVGYGRQVNGQTVYLEKTETVEVPIIIDQTPELIIVPEIDDAFKDQDPVVSPGTDTTLTLQVLNIDIPVEVKADYPIQVEINDDGIWRDMEQI